VAEKNRTQGAARLRFFVARAANGGEAYTDLLDEVKTATKRPPWTAGDLFLYFSILLFFFYKNHCVPSFIIMFFHVLSFPLLLKNLFPVYSHRNLIHTMNLFPFHSFAILLYYFSLFFQQIF
jgi:hypothetical protein